MGVGRNETEDRSREGEKEHRRGKAETIDMLSESSKQGQKNSDAAKEGSQEF